MHGTMRTKRSGMGMEQLASTMVPDGVDQRRGWVKDLTGWEEVGSKI